MYSMKWNFRLLFISLMFFNIFAVHGLPKCCFASTQYPEAQNIVQCILNCSNSSEEKSNFCASCYILKSDDEILQQYFTDVIFSKPQMVCQELVQRKKNIYGQLILSWEFRSSFDFSIIFLIEVQNPAINGSWHFVGMTNETIAKISNLEIQMKYQFRVTPVTTFSKEFKALLSDWILVPDSISISSPKEIRATNFDYDQNLHATIEWTASNERPCSYQLYCLPSHGSEYFIQKTVTVTNNNLSTILTGLSFETNYTIKVFPYEEDELRQVFSAEESFITPSCLSITNGNFSLCAPGPPLNFTASWSPTSLEAVLMWQPPHFSSGNNEVSNYSLTIVEMSEKLESMFQYRDRILLEKNSSVITLHDLQPSRLYILELRARSPRGTGPPAVTELDTKTVRMHNFLSDWHYILPWHYIIPSSLCLLLVLSAALILQIVQNRRKAEILIYPNGLADVPDHLLPSLVPSNKIELQDVLGHGAFGIVHRGLYTHKKFKEEVAVKTFPADTSTRKILLNEIDILKLIGRHDHVVSLVGFTLNIDKMYLILEFCALGDLQSYLPRFKKLLQGVKSEQKLSRSMSRDPKYGVQLCRYIYQVAVGMEHISSLKLIHRDIAARNILMHTEEHVKIADFGLSKDIYETQNYCSTTKQRLPIKWMAPEAIERQRFNVRTDVWSFGVLMWEIFKFGQEPYLGYPNSEILTLLKSGMRLVKPNTCNKEWYDLMLKCWHADPKRRPSFRELVQKSGDTIAAMSNYTAIIIA